MVFNTTHSILFFLCNSNANLKLQINIWNLYFCFIPPFSIFPLNLVPNRLNNYILILNDYTQTQIHLKLWRARNYTKTKYVRSGHLGFARRHSFLLKKRPKYATILHTYYARQRWLSAVEPSNNFTPCCFRDKVKFCVWSFVYFLSCL